MPIKVICPNCSAKLKVPDALAGKAVRCVRCRTAVPVPEQDNPWSALDQGDSVNEVVPPKPIPVGKLVTSSRPAAASPTPAPGPVSASVEDNANPFAFGDLTPLPDALRAVKSEAPATLPGEEDALERRRRREKAKKGKGMIGLAVGVGTLAAVVLTVAVTVFVIRNSHNEPAASKVADRPAETPAATRTNATLTVADGAAKPSKPSLRTQTAARSATTNGRKPAVTAPTRAAPIDPDNPPDLGKGPIPVPLGGGTPKARTGEEMPAKPPGDKDKKDEKKE